ncbi:hypothetical protein MKW94_029249 [Papaver nudicaule]|uniref:Ubiquitin-activating enzyme E1 C-terminal domain-containing protein n=1 Tax=Papaver nudicaule TaxID=74823 RepID=A0AA41S347_PAPNU|nr:hypothetical protein [Papaver nudicaule]
MEVDDKPVVLNNEVLISGMNGLGAEIAKNLILSGVKLVTLHDEGLVERWDMSSNFLYSETDVGKNRALASVQKLQELNSAVTISTLTEKLSKEQLSNYQAVVFTDIGFEAAIEFDEYCHNHEPAICFIKTEVRGLFGSMFCDFGPEFVVEEEPHAGRIESISNNNPAVIRCIDHNLLEFREGDSVVFREVHGMIELNNECPRRITEASSHYFVVDMDTKNYGVYVKGGIVEQARTPQVLKFKPLRQALNDPGGYHVTDALKSDRASLLHLAFQALDKFVREFGCFPAAGSEGDAKKLISYSKDINGNAGDRRLEEIDEQLLLHFSFGCKAVLNPMAAMFGGIAAQEVVKALSGKFYPVQQFFYFDSVESLPAEPLDPNDLKPVNGRYDAQISVFGSKLQKKLEESKVFMVGSGALGCEILKNFSMMGVACSNQGKVTITDDDEETDFSTLFSSSGLEIGQVKSKVAASACLLMNPRFQIEALQNRLFLDTNKFDYKFWRNLDVVFSATKNLDARIYMDNNCVFFNKPLLLSGTLGAQSSTEIFIPEVTENYGSSMKDYDNSSFLHNVDYCLGWDRPEIVDFHMMMETEPFSAYSYPRNVDHCLTWAATEFEILFKRLPNEVNKCVSNFSEYINAVKAAKGGDGTQAKRNLQKVLECLEPNSWKDIHSCISWARQRFDYYFVDHVKMLTSLFPENAKTHLGANFWKKPHFPKPTDFSVKDPYHLHCIRVLATLRANTYNIAVPKWFTDPGKLAQAVNFCLLKFSDPVRELQQSLSEHDDMWDIEDLIKKLKSVKLSPGFRMNPIHFNKDDDDTNYHMDLIVCLANLRARNYNILQVELLRAKRKVKAAIASSKAITAGLMCLELYKVIDGSHKLMDYRNTFVDLVQPKFCLTPPIPAKVYRHGIYSWTVWSSPVLQIPKLETLGQFVLRINNLYVVKVLRVVLFGVPGCLYDSNNQSSTDRPLLELVEDVVYIPLSSIRLAIICKGVNGNSIFFPSVIIFSDEK